MRKKFLLTLTVLALLVGAIFVGCQGTTPQEPQGPSVIFVKEATVPAGERYEIDIQINPEDTQYILVVKDPSGNQVDLVDNAFTPSVLGVYTFKITFAEKEEAGIIRVVDGTSPVINTQISDKTNVETGEYDFFGDLNEIVATDDVDSEVNKTIVSIKFGNEVAKNVQNDKAVLDKVGVYTVNGYVMDNSENKTYFSYKITTVDSIAPVIISAKGVPAML